MLFILTLVASSCDFDNDKNDIKATKYTVNKGFKFNKELSKNYSGYKIIVQTKTDNIVTGVILETPKNQMYSFDQDNYKFYFEQNNLLISNQNTEETHLFNFNKNRNSILNFLLIKHSLELKKVFDEDILNIYTSESCYAEKENQAGKIESKTFVYSEIINDNTSQLIVESDNYVYIYKVDIDNDIRFNTSFEPITRVDKRYNSNPFKDSSISSVFLNEDHTYIKSTEVIYTDSDYDIDDSQFEWSSNHKLHRYKLTKHLTYNNIKDEL